MKKLTNTQKEFILDNFFKNEKYPGWKNIATELIENGHCIVAGTECIWVGGIGNFINTEEANNAVGCTLYKFNLDYFMTSIWYTEYRSMYVSKLYNKVKEIKQEFDEIACSDLGEDLRIN